MRQRKARGKGGEARKATGSFRPISDSVSPGAFASGGAVMLELLRGRWKAIAGEGLWAYSWPMSLTLNRLTVAVESSTALAAVRGLKDRILERVRAIPALRDTRSVTFRVDPDFMAMARSGNDPALSALHDNGASGAAEVSDSDEPGRDSLVSDWERFQNKIAEGSGKPELCEAFRNFIEGIDRAMDGYRRQGFKNCGQCGKRLTPGGKLCLQCEAEQSEARLFKIEDLLLGASWLPYNKIVERFPGASPMEFARATQWVSEVLEQKMWDAFYAYASRPEKDNYVALEQATSSVVMLATGLEPKGVNVDTMKEHAPEAIRKALAGGK